MHGNILFMFDYWPNPVIHLLLLESSMNGQSTLRSKLVIDEKWNRKRLREAKQA